MNGMPLSARERAELEDLIGYRFNVPGRLDLALTHASARNFHDENYERLEFLGDRVLGLCVAELLFSMYGSASEGELSVRLNQLVSAHACAKVADRMGLHVFIRTGADVKTVTGSRMMNVRADVIESLIAALYLDGGLEVARNFVLEHWRDDAVRADGARRDAKTELQEWAHQKFAVTPHYHVVERTGPDHAPRFTVKVEIDAIAPEIGVDGSKRTAEQAAASRMLKREGVWADES